MSKFLHNPISGEVRSTSPLQAKRLLTYGWRPITEYEYLKAKRDILHYVVKHKLAKVPVRMH